MGSMIVAPPDTTRSGYSSSLNCSRGSPWTQMRSAGAPSTSRPSGASPRCSPARAVAADNTSCGVSAPCAAWNMSCSSWASIPQGTSIWPRSVPYSSLIPASTSWLALPATPVQCDCVSSVLTTRTPAAAARAISSGEIGSQGTWAHSSTPASSATLAPSGPLRCAATMRSCAWASSTIARTTSSEGIGHGGGGAELVPAPWCARRATRIQADLDQRGTAGDEPADGRAGGLDIGHLQSGAGAEHRDRIATGCGEDRPGAQHPQPPIATRGCHQRAAGVPDRRDAVPQEFLRWDPPKQRMTMQVDEAGKQRAGKADALGWAGEPVGRCHGRDPITPDRDRVVLEHSRAVEHPIRGDDVPVAESSPCGLAHGGPSMQFAGSHDGSSFRRDWFCEDGTS